MNFINYKEVLITADTFLIKFRKDNLRGDYETRPYIMIKGVLFEKNENDNNDNTI